MSQPPAPSGPSCLVDVIVPGGWWHALTYSYRDSANPVPRPGVRVRVPLAKTTRTGFVLGPGTPPPETEHGPRYEILDVLETLEQESPLDADLWDLALWMGRAFLCGAGTALMCMCPKELLKGEPVSRVSLFRSKASSGSSGPSEFQAKFQEHNCFTPWDEKRRSFYLERISDEKRTLMLFPTVQEAENFFVSLPDSLRDGAMLWPSAGGKKLWDAWRSVYAGEFRLVISPPGGVFAPFRPERIIVEDEASPAYVFQRAPRISARSLAGRRALTLNAELVLGGRVPSSRTFYRTSPPCDTLPDRKQIIFADIRRSVKAGARGTEGSLPLTVSLLRRTRDVLAGGRHVLWILDRRGEAAEVFCPLCGHEIRCPRCGSVMRSEDSGRRLRCIRCGTKEDLPSRCPVCRGELWSGRRPGLEALAVMAERQIYGFPVLLFDVKTGRAGRAGSAEKIKFKAPSGASLILGTRGALSLCDTLDIGLAAWLDLDAELRRPEYGARFNAFSMVWESCWRGRRSEQTDRTERLVLIQCRRQGKEWHDFLMRGWEYFWRNELALRQELELPPFGLMVQIELPPKENRENFIRSMEEAGLFVMDPGDPALPLWTASPSVEPLVRALSPRFSISESRRGFPRITVWSE